MKKIEDTKTEQAPAPATIPPDEMDPATKKKKRHRLHGPLLGGHVYSKQTESFAKGDFIQESGIEYVGDVVARLGCRDPLEEMLAIQSLWLHTRLAHLSFIANQQTDRKTSQMINDSCDRAANAYRRHMLALAEYRRPPRTDSFVAIRQANVAQQQVVNNAETQKSENPAQSNEKGFQPATTTEALPTHADGTGIPSQFQREGEAVATSDRPAVNGREGTV